MSGQPLAILASGLQCAVGFDAPSACAAMRAKLSNPSPTGFMDAGGSPIMGHRVPYDEPSRGLARLVRMACAAIGECVEGAEAASADALDGMPLLLCVAGPERPGRMDGLDDALAARVRAKLGWRPGAGSAVFALGRTSVAWALLHARRLVYEHGAARVLIAAADSLLSWPTLRRYEKGARLLTSVNSNGFMPGEAGAAVLVGKPPARTASEPPTLLCTGIGLADETACLGSGEPLRGDGLTTALKRALGDAGCEMHQLDFRIADVCGEQYFFKEAALALNRTLRAYKSDLPLWTPAQSTGDCGAALGLVCIALAQAALRKAYAPGERMLLHFSDAGRRAAVVGVAG